MAEVWWRNADTYHREVAELRLTNFIWSSQYIERRSLDVEAFAKLFVPAELDYRILIADEHGTCELSREHSLKNPRAVYPTWDYLIDDVQTLEELLDTNIAESYEKCNDGRVPKNQRPVYQQEHRVLIVNTPDAGLGISRKFIAMLRDMQHDYPHAIMHVFGMASYRISFGMRFASVDTDPWARANINEITLPNGKKVTRKQASKFHQWIHLLGYKPVDMEKIHERTMYNIKSALWANEHWDEVVPFRVRAGKEVIDYQSPHVPPATVKDGVAQLPRGTVGDKVLCDQCSLAEQGCKFFRAGEVCSLPGSDSAEFVSLFKTRDPDQILDGLGSLMEIDQKRLQRALKDEEDFGGPNDRPLDPEVTKINKSLFDKGVKLVKLLDPKRFAAGAKVQVNVGGQQSLSVGPTPQQMIGGIVKELQAQGFTPDQITPELVETMLGRANAIEVQAIEAPSA